LGETSLHDSVKRLYSNPGDLIEERVDGYLIDIVRGSILIEIQTRGFSSIRKKLENLVENHKIHLVHPISERKWIVRLNKQGDKISRRRSPRKGRVEDLFLELVYMPTILKKSNFSLEVILVHSEEELINDGKGSWRRKKWSVHDKRLLCMIEEHLFNEPRDFQRLLPANLPEKFTTRELSKMSDIKPYIAQKMTYCLRHMEVLEVVGKRGRSILYSLNEIM
jgi:hypothetical protein